jgi:hypothetical protein|tara:strand:+ start:148 stop:351 length:204 start_codon:yes stop_codon:yes gene_type:complete
MKEYIIARPAHTNLVEYVLVREGEQGFYSLSDVVKHNTEWADNFNASQGHSENDLNKALLNSMTGKW